MKLKMTRFKDGEWENIKVEELIGNSPCSLIADSFDLMFGAIYTENDEIILVMTNCKKGLDMYDKINEQRKEKGKCPIRCVLALEVEALFKIDPLKAAFTVFPDSDFFVVKTIESEE